MVLISTPAVLFLKIVLANAIKSTGKALRYCILSIVFYFFLYNFISSLTLYLEQLLPKNFKLHLIAKGFIYSNYKQY